MKNDINKTDSFVDSSESQLGPKKNKKYDVFISYRRRSNSILARLMYEVFKRKGLQVFLDIDELHVGDFDSDIENAIANCKNFLIVLSKGDLDRCKNKNDWLTREIATAIKCGKPIIPVAVEKECPIPNDLPDEIKSFASKQQFVFENKFYDKSMENIEKELMGIKWKKKFDITSVRSSNDYYKDDITIELKRLLVLQQTEEKIDKSILKDILNKYDEIRVVSSGVDDGVRVMKTFGAIDKVKKITMTEANKFARNLNIKKHASDRVKIYDFSSSNKKYAENLKSTIGPDGKLYNVAFICHSLYGSSKPLNILKALYQVLEPGGTIIIMEIDDGLEINYPDKNHYFERLSSIRFDSPWSGNRYTGRQTYGYLKMVGFKDIKLANGIVDNTSLTHQQRWELFNAECSRIYNDLEKLCASQPENEEYKANRDWLANNWDKMEMEYLSDDFFSCYGYLVWVAVKK